MDVGYVTLQGMFFNAYFIAYLISPKLCHTFVGYLEEEAVKTYTHCISDLDQGRLPGWSTKKVDSAAACPGCVCLLPW